MTERMSDEEFFTTTSHPPVEYARLIAEASRARAAEAALLARVRELEALGLSSHLEERDALSLSLKEHVEMLGVKEQELEECRDRVKELEGEVSAGARLVTFWMDKANDYEAQSAEFQQEIVDCPIDEVQEELARHKAARMRAMGIKYLPLEFNGEMYSAGWNHALYEVSVALQIKQPGGGRNA